MSKQERVDALMARAIEWPVPRTAVRMIAMEEDCRLVAYKCSAKVWTCGWGETEGVTRGMRWTQEYADERLRQSLTEWGAAVRAMCTVHTSEGEFSALLCLSYNIGLDGLKGSTVLRQHNVGNRLAAARAFGLWNKVRNAAGVLEVSEGLTARRAREQALYLQPDDDAPTERMPQAVEAESKLTTSPIAVSGAATAATGGLATITSASQGLKDATGALGEVQVAAAALGSTVQTVTGLPPAALVGALLVGLGYLVVKWRRKQRAEGYA